ncbi:MAG: type II toxin-antitoxin system VapC family toxin [Wenzhouxiangellaceae bacterium]|nr:type II toxin-antitoxin system VapC family toxin [Wenzhouxiangellaceae bacterium]
MILPDANLLIYAVNRDAPHHRQARLWLEQTLSGSESIGLAWIVVLAFLRITTHPRVFDKPLAVAQALDYVEGWLGQPCVRSVAPGEKHWLVLSRLLRASGSAGNLTSDAHLAAIAIEQGAIVHSADHDFKRFDGLESVNPISGVHEDSAEYGD